MDHPIPVTFIRLIVLLPLLGAAINFLAGAWLQKTFGKRAISIVGCGVVLAAFGVAVTAFLAILKLPPENRFMLDDLWKWFDVGGLNLDIAFWLDPLSMIMTLIITGVGGLIHIYSTGYMHDDDGFWRFFGWLNLFTFAMLVLVLGDNMWLMFVGWEGVGLCSFALIGFWYKVQANSTAGNKAFIVNRVGDLAFVIALYSLFAGLQAIGHPTLVTREVAHYAPLLAGVPINFAGYQSAHTLVGFVTLLMFIGATGKSAQIPLYVWLPDAMAGPTPVSALIHAATMVTAGVYLIARTHGLFELAPFSLETVGVIGATTLLLASCAALVQSDIKRILAYSTMSQIGYMFLALGSAAWGASIFHLMTHAFFKALLFLTSGAVILACHHEQDIFKMGGLRKQLPLEYACFLVGGLALAAFPFITAGYYSKDEILWEAYAAGHSGLFLAGLVGAFLTPLYTFRLIFTVFHGEAKIQAHRGRGVTYWLPLAVLLVFSTFVGGMIHPPLAGVLPAASEQTTNLTKLAVGILSSTVALGGIAVACGLFLGPRRLVGWLAGTLPGRLLARWWVQGWGFDWLYDRLLVRPFVWF